MQSTYEIGDRVQASRFALLRQASVPEPKKKTEASVGIVQGYRTPQKGLARVNVRWLIDVYPHEYDQVMRVDYIEPLGTKR